MTSDSTTSPKCSTSGCINEAEIQQIAFVQATVNTTTVVEACMPIKAGVGRYVNIHYSHVCSIFQLNELIFWCGYDSLITLV